MSIDIPFVYEVTLDLANGGSDKRQYQDVFTIDPGIVMEEDAPIALRSILTEGQARYSDPPATYRVIEGQFYRMTNAQAGTEMFLIELLNVVQREGFSKINHGQVKRRGSPKENEIRYSDRERLRERLSAILDRACFVGPHLYLACDEPRLVETSDPSLGNGILKLSHRSSTRESIAFRPDEKDAAGLYSSHWPEAFLFETLRPEFFAGHYVDDRLRSAADRLASSVAGFVAYLPRSAIEDFCTVRTALRDYEKIGASTDEIIDRGMRLVEVARAEEPATGYFFPNAARLFELACSDVAQARVNGTIPGRSGVLSDEDHDALLGIGF